MDGRLIRQSIADQLGCDFNSVDNSVLAGRNLEMLEREFLNDCIRTFGLRPNATWDDVSSYYQNSW